MALEMLPFRTQPLSLSLNFISVGSEEITIYDCSDGASGTRGWCPVAPQGQLPRYTGLSSQPSAKEAGKIRWHSKLLLKKKPNNCKRISYAICSLFLHAQK